MDDVLKKLAIAASISSLTLISGCDLFDDDDTTSEDDPVTVTGDVVQGPVSGATVCADKHTTTYPIGNGICDSGERSTTTASDGSFDDLIIPDGYGEYTLISSGGVDTISGKAALPMRAPAGVDRITPVTTLVASISDSTEREALIEKLEEATGGDYDADPSDAAADADLVLLTKSVEQTLRAVDEIGFSDDDQKLEVAASIATAISTDANSTFSSSGINATTLATDISTSAVDAIEDIIEELGNDAPVALSDAEGDNPSGAAVLEDIIEAVVDNVGTAVGCSEGVCSGTASESTVTTSIDTVDEILNADGNEELLEDVGNTVTTATMDVDAIYILNGDVATPVDLDDPDTITADDVDGIRVVIDADNGFETAKTYTGATITLTVKDASASNDRMVKFVLSGVTVAISANGEEDVATLNLDSATLTTVAKDGAGNEISTEAISGPYEVLDLTTANTLEITISELEDLLSENVADEFGTIIKEGTFNISLTATGAPLKAKAITVTVQ